MYLSYTDIFVFIVLPVLGFIGMWFCKNQREKELYDMYSEKDEQYRKLYEEYKKIKKCDICGSPENVSYYPTSGYEENNGVKTFFSGGVNICKNCINECKLCSVCNKLLPTEKIKSYIGYKMKHPDFCEHLFAHEKINRLKKKYNIM